MSLRQHLDVPTSPVRQAFKEHLPRLAASMRTTWKPAFADVEATTAPVGQPADVLGHAISERLVWVRAALSCPSSRLTGADQLVLAGASPSVISELEVLTAAPAVHNTEHAARAAALVGLLDRARRYGPALTEDWYEPLLRATRLEDALASVPEAWVVDLVAVTDRCSSLLEDLPGPAIAGPVFAGSAAVGGADADLILGGTVIEIKATRTPELRLRDAQQVIGYALLDLDDTFELSRAALLSARFGQLVSWDLEDLLDQAGGITMAQMRSHLARAVDAAPPTGL